MDFLSRARWFCRPALASDPIRERLVIDQFQDEELLALGFVETVDGGDVRMVERGQHLRFPPEAADALGIVRETVGEDFQRDITSFVSRARYTSPIPPLPSGRDDFVHTEPDADDEGHFFRSPLQLSTTVIGGGGGSSAYTFIRNR